MTSRIAYGTPRVQLKAKQHSKLLDVLIRKAYKISLGLPAFSPSEHLLAPYTAQQAHTHAIVSNTYRPLCSRETRPPRQSSVRSAQHPRQRSSSPVPCHAYANRSRGGRRAARIFHIMQRHYSRNVDSRYTDAARCHRRHPDHVRPRSPKKPR